MIFVIDTNVIISAALRQSITQELIFNSAFQFYTPEYVKEEIEKHKNEILRKSGYNESRFNAIMALIFSRITIVPEEEYRTHRDEIMKLAPDKKDWPFLALAKQLGVGLWTYDSVLKSKQNIVKVFTTRNLKEMLK